MTGVLVIGVGLKVIDAGFIAPLQAVNLVAEAVSLFNERRCVRKMNDQFSSGSSYGVSQER